MKLEKLLLEVSMSNRAMKIEFVYDEVKNKIKKIGEGKSLNLAEKAGLRYIKDWINELYSRIATSATVHKKVNEITALDIAFKTYLKAKHKNDEESMRFAKKLYDRKAKEIYDRLSKFYGQEK